MTSKGKQKENVPEPASQQSPIRQMKQQGQLDFEIEFFGKIVESCPDYVEVLKVLGNNLTMRKRYKEGLEIDRRLLRLRPKDPLAHYNLACSYALLRKTDAAINALRKAVEYGYRDFRYIKEDKDLESIRQDARYKRLMRELDK